MQARSPRRSFTRSTRAPRSHDTRRTALRTAGRLRTAPLHLATSTSLSVGRRDRSAPAEQARSCSHRDQRVDAPATIHHDRRRASSRRARQPPPRTHDRSSGALLHLSSALLAVRRSRGRPRADLLRLARQHRRRRRDRLSLRRHRDGARVRLARHARHGRRRRDGEGASPTSATRRACTASPSPSATATASRPTPATRRPRCSISPRWRRSKRFTPARMAWTASCTTTPTDRILTIDHSRPDGHRRRDRREERRRS